MKFLAWIGGVLATVVVAVYVVAFTPIGNSIVGPIVEEKIKEQTLLDSKLSTFSLTMSEFSIVLEINTNNIIYVNGTYSIFSKAFNVLYRANLNELETLEVLTNVALKGSVKTQGTVKGDMAFIEIDGTSDLASSDTSYHVELTEFNPTSIVAKVQKLKLDELLNIAAQKSYASADVNLDVNFRSIKSKALDGDILLRTQDGRINSKVMKNDFNITIPSRTDFAMNMDAKLKDETIEYTYNLMSNLFKITSSGNVIPTPLKTDVVYELDIKELALLKPITGADLRGALRLKGDAKGTKEKLVLNGESDIASSDTSYHVELTEFNPTSIIAEVKHLSLGSLLKMTNNKAYASADVDLNVNFKNIKPHALDGDISLSTKGAKLNTKVLKKDFAITIPRTNFAMNLDAKLKGDDVDYTYKLISNLFKIASSGKVIPTPLKTDIKYALDIKELALLKPVTGADVRGSFRLNGSVKGTKAKLVVDGKSDVASSDTRFEAILKDFSPASVKASMKNLKLAKVLYMLKQPHYADGIFSLDVNIPDARSGKLNGKVISSLKKGLVDAKYMTKAYKFKTPMPQTAFQMTTTTTLNGDIIDSKVDLDSTLANFDIKRARVDLKNSTIVSDYIARVEKLDSLYFATEQHMKGGITVNGELNKAKDLDLTILSNVAGGKIDAKLHNDDFHADILGVQTLDALHMLIYPEIFKASLDAKLDYNLASKKGKFKGHLIDGKFTKNQMFTLIKQYAKVDMYVEKFKGDVNADINKEKIVASMDLKSNTSSIKTKNTKLNTKTKMIDSRIDVVANNNPVSVILKGKTSSPKVSLDVEDLIKKEAGKAIEKEVGKLLKGFF